MQVDEGLAPQLLAGRFPAGLLHLLHHSADLDLQEKALSAMQVLMSAHPSAADRALWRRHNAGVVRRRWVTSDA